MSPAAEAAGDHQSHWRRLSPEEFAVLREGATEPAFSGQYAESTDVGTYHCRACDAPLFTALAKFASGCGWPAFWQALEDTTGRPAVVQLPDHSHGLSRVEVRCRGCDSHLGHLFTGEGYDTAIDQRYCINSLALKLHPLR